MNLNAFSNRNYMIISSSDVPNIDFSEILQESADTLRGSVDGDKVVVKWESESIPTSIDTLINKDGPYNHEEISTIMIGDNWMFP